MGNHSNYRPDVDGLRAVAVVLVILFHSELLFGGGFVGVDVFFVISGFLITGILQRNLREGRFSFTGFWMRRIRRIVPAVSVMALTTVLAGSLLLSPRDYQDLATSALAQQAMAANIYFWRTTNYFGTSAEVKPLMHTWSLAVEEQFYLLYPLLLALLHRVGRRVAIGTLVGLAILSLAISQWGLKLRPTAVFFLLPPRAWEMILGGLLCRIPPLPDRRVIHEGAGWLGLLMILVPAVMYDKTTPFPGLTALLPCGGAALLIHSNVSRLNLVGHGLASRPMVFVGLLSYSLYLWHWPLFAFTRYFFGLHLSTLHTTLLLAATAALGWLSWRFVETPFRTGIALADGRRFFAVVGGMTAALVAIGLAVVVNRGFPGRFPDELNRIFAVAEEGVPDPRRRSVSLEDLRTGNLPAFGAADGTKTCLLWGDSHAQCLIPGLDDACQALGWRCLQATYYSTPPLFDFPITGNVIPASSTQDYSPGVIENALREHAQVVILGGIWAVYAKYPEFEQRLRQTLETLAAHNIQALVTLDVPLYEIDVPRALVRSRLLGLAAGDPTQSAERYLSPTGAGRANAIIRRVAGETGALILDPAPYLTDPQGDWTVFLDGECLYSDAHHLSLAGGRRLRPMFKAALEELRPRPTAPPSHPDDRRETSPAPSL